MKLLLATVFVMLLCGCNVKPFGFAPWVIVMPGARLNVVVGNKSEDHRVDSNKMVDKQASVGDKEIKKGFVPPKMGK